MAMTLGGEGRGRALASLSDRLAPDEWRETLVTARLLQDADDWAALLTRLVPKLPEEVRQDFVQEALDAARSIQVVSKRTQLLTMLIPCLHDPDKEKVQQEATRAAEAILGDLDRANALVDLAANLSRPACREVLEEAVSATRSSRQFAGEAQVLTKIAVGLAEQGYCADGVALARTIRTQDDQAQALMLVANHMSDPERQAVLREAAAAARFARRLIAGTAFDFSSAPLTQA